MKCGFRFTTYEIVEREELRVVKRNGARENFNRDKLLSGVRKACEKRPVKMEDIEQLVDDIATELAEEGYREIPSTVIGAKLMTMSWGGDRANPQNAGLVQVKDAAASGALRPGEALPSVRALAEELRINRNTAARAYTELEAEGIIPRQMGSYGLAQCLRLSIGREEENRRVVAALAGFVAGRVHG